MPTSNPHSAHADPPPASDSARGRVEPHGGASFIYDRADSAGRNQFVWFRRRFTLRHAPDEAAWMHLFADTCYRLWVNGRIVAYGPARFVPGFAEYDSVDLRPHLRAGRNVIAVEVHHIGASNFQSMPGTPGGLIAWGRIDDGAGGWIDLATPGQWRTRRCEARDAQAPAFSFARGPVEVLDTRCQDPAWLDPDASPPTEAGWAAAVELPDQNAWGPLTACTAPPLQMDQEDRPTTPGLSAALAETEQRLVARLFAPGAWEARRAGGQRYRFAYATFLHSPRAQSVTLGLFWGPHFLNGQPLTAEPDPLRGNRHQARASLREGWNLLYGEPEVLMDAWPLLIGLPRDAGLRAAADPDPDCRAELRHTPPLPDPPGPRDGAEAPADAEALDALGLTWARVDPDARPAAPAREVAWDVPASEEAATDAVNGPHDAESRVWVYDFEREYLGHPIIELDAPAGTVVDVAYDERLREDGLLGLFRTNPFSDTADRFIARGGTQTIEGFHWRAGRYMQVTLRPPSGQAHAAEPPTLRRVAVRATRAAMPVEGSFACSDPLLTWAWRLGVQTIRASAADVFCDGPWREGGCYLGDLYTQIMAALSFTGERRLSRRSLLLFAQSQRADGQMQAVAPAWYQTALEDYTLLFILQLRDYWARTGERELVESCWPAIERIWASPVWREGESGLWSAEGLHVFADWGAGRAAKSGDDNAVLNAFRYQALRDTAELAGATGRDDVARRYQQRAAALKTAFSRTLWHAEAGRFAAGRRGSELVDQATVHGNILALAFGLADESQRPSVLAFVCRRLAENPARALAGENHDDHVELYFLRYALQALYRAGRVAEAERVMREHFAPMHEADAWCAWEALHRGAKGVGSLCHGWSAAPTQMLTERTLGVQLTADPRRVRIAPAAGEVTWAEGAVPHPLGALSVRWRREGDELRVEVDAPAEVSVSVEPAGPLADLRLMKTIHPSGRADDASADAAASPCRP